MPTYKNEQTYTIVASVLDPITKKEKTIEFAAGREKAVKYYLDHPDLTFVSHRPRIRPFKTLHEGTIATLSTLTGLSDYDELIVYNDSGANLVLTPNADTSNTMTVPQGERRTFTMDNRWYSLAGSGSGAGNIYIYAVEERY